MLEVDYNQINRVSKVAFNPHPGNNKYSNHYIGVYFKRFTSMAMVVAGIGMVVACWENFVDSVKKPASEYSSRNGNMNGYPPRNDRRDNRNYRNNNNRNFQRR